MSKEAITWAASEEKLEEKENLNLWQRKRDKKSEKRKNSPDSKNNYPDSAKTVSSCLTINPHNLRNRLEVNGDNGFAENNPFTA